MKIAILQQRQDWEPPQIKDLRLVIAEDCTFMASNTIFIALGIPDDYLEKTTQVKVNFTHCLIQNISGYITSSSIIVTALQTNQQS